MVLCPVCNKENNDNKYCTDCGTKLVNIENNSNFEFDKNNYLTKIDELNIYLNELNEKIRKQKKYLDELKKEYGTLSKINEENNDLKKKIEDLKQNKKNILLKLKQEQKKSSELQSEIDKTNFCPNCGYKL